MTLASSEKQARLRERYAGRFAVPALSVGTVRDYCDSCDHLPALATAQGDLKDLQRPWTVKAILGSLPPGGRLLEIGGGQPLVAAQLTELGYQVTVVDPYDGSGSGPTEYESFQQDYPGVRLVRRRFEPGVPELAGERFEGIYSISVLEHVPLAPLAALFEAIGAHLVAGGCSLHAIDCVVEGGGHEFHLAQCAHVARHQAALAGREDEGVAERELAAVLENARSACETYYLSAEGHNRWRGAMAYEDFPFRKVLSVQTVARAAAQRSSGV